MATIVSDHPSASENCPRSRWMCREILHAGDGPLGKKCLVAGHRGAKLRAAEAAAKAAESFARDDMTFAERDGPEAFAELEGAEYHVAVEFAPDDFVAFSVRATVCVDWQPRIQRQPIREMGYETLEGDNQT